MGGFFSKCWSKALISFITVTIVLIALVVVFASNCFGRTYTSASASPSSGSSGS